MPEPKPEDAEDVSWALSTAEAMWARGDHLEGIKWVRRAAEAASEAEDDRRSLELAKAAADLAGLISRRRASIDIEEVVVEPDPSRSPAPPPVPAAKPAANKPAPPKPAPAPIVAAPNLVVTPVAPVVTAAAAPAKPIKTTPSRPPAPLPSRTSQPPPGKGKPLGTNSGSGRPPSMRPGTPRDGKKARRSRENLEAEARAALAPALTPSEVAAPTPAMGGPVVVETAKPHGGHVDEAAARILRADTQETAVAQIPVMPPRRRPEDPTTISRVEDVAKAQRSSADEWDIDSTQNLTGDEFPFSEGDRMTAVALPAGVDFKSTLQSFACPGAADAEALAAPAGANAGANTTDGAAGPRVAGGGTNPPATVAAILPGPGGGLPVAPSPAAPLASPRASEPHDPQIATSQAVRVVVWRDASGVHVAPAGTIVSAITVDAVLVALEPSADLTAWLTQRGR